MQMKGTIKFFNAMKNFGFITGEDGKEYFVHITGVEEGYQPKDEDNVVFDTEQGERGIKAVNVRFDDGSAGDSEAVEETASESASDEE